MIIVIILLLTGQSFGLKKKNSSEKFQNATIQKLKKIATPIFRCFEENSRIFQDIVTDSTLHNLCGL